MGNWRIRLPVAAKMALHSTRRNRRKTRLAHAAQRHRSVGRRLQMHFDLARRSIDAGDLKHLEVVLLGARF
jgi:hypothetical protein